MKCPFCYVPESKVIDSRPSDNGMSIRRRRECTSCGRKFTTYERVEDEIFVKLNHPMEKEHYIEWISLVKGEEEYFVKLYPEQNAECRFKYIPGSTIYAYCNKHQLWKKDVE